MPAPVIRTNSGFVRISSIVEQPVYNLFERHRFSPDYDRVYRDYGYGATTWSPLASGLLTGKYKDGIPKGSRGDLQSMEWLQDHLTDAQKLAAVEALAPLARDLGATPAQFAIAWCLKNPHVSSVITGASRVEQVHENMRATEIAAKMTPDVLEATDRIFRGDA